MNIKNIREKKMLTQEQLAAKIGVTQGTVSAWEVGFWEPSLYNTKKLASALEVSVDELLADPEPVKETNEL